MNSIHSLNSSDRSFLTNSFCTTLPRLLKSPGVVSNLLISDLSIFNFKLPQSAFLSTVVCIENSPLFNLFKLVFLFKLYFVFTIRKWLWKITHLI